MRQKNIDILSDQTLLDLADCLFQFVPIKRTTLIDLNLKGVTYQKPLSKILTSFSIENFYDQAIDSDTKQYEEKEILQQEQIKITLLDVCWIINASKMNIS